MISSELGFDFPKMQERRRKLGYGVFNVSVRDMIILALAEWWPSQRSECTISPAVYGAQRRDKATVSAGSTSPGPDSPETNF